MFSAIKKDGKKLYELARRGIAVEREKRRVRIDTLELLSFDRRSGRAEIYVECSKGTYIRSLIDDMGTEMGTAFTVSALYNLINNRLMAKRPMIVNTNLMPEALSEKYSPAVASRLLGEFMALRFFGDDIRLLKKKM